MSPIISQASITVTGSSGLWIFFPCSDVSKHVDGMNQNLAERMDFGWDSQIGHLKVLYETTNYALLSCLRVPFT